MTAQPDSFIADVFGSPVPPAAKPSDPTLAAYDALILTLYNGTPERALIETMRHLYVAECDVHANPDDFDDYCDWLANEAAEVGESYRAMGSTRRSGPDREKGE